MEGEKNTQKRPTLTLEELIKLRQLELDPGQAMPGNGIFRENDQFIVMVSFHQHQRFISSTHFF